MMMMMMINTFHHKVKVGPITSVTMQLTFYTFYVISFIFRQLNSPNTMVENYKDKTRNK